MKINDKIYFCRFKRGSGWGNLETTKVTKVGSKYFQVEQFRDTPIDKNTMVDGNTYNSNYTRYFLSENDYLEYFQRKAITSFFSGYFSGYTFEKKLEDISLEDLMTVYNILNK